jgi:hypothetical protein
MTLQLRRLRSRLKPRELSTPVWVAIIGSASVILVATVQFVIAPLLFRAEPPVRSNESAKKKQPTSVSASDSFRISGLDPGKRRENFQILASPTTAKGIRTFRGDPVSVNLVDASIKDFVMMMGQITGVNFSLQPDVIGSVTVHVEDVPWDAVLDDVLAQNWLEYRISGDVVRIVPKPGAPPWKQ